MTKIIAAWPDYRRNRIVTVNEDGDIIMQDFPAENPWADSEKWIRKLADFLYEYEYCNPKTPEEVYKEFTKRYKHYRLEFMARRRYDNSIPTSQI